VQSRQFRDEGADVKPEQESDLQKACRPLRNRVKAQSRQAAQYMSHSSVRVRTDDLSSPEVRALVAEHLAGMHGNTPPGHVNALAIEGLRQPGVTFLTAWLGSDLCGCGALKVLDSTSGEVKSMRTRSQFLRMGVGQAVLDEIVRLAEERNCSRLYLETGTGPAFAAAHTLYLRNGFAWCGAFGSYVGTDFNVFMVKSLGAASGAA
jgi:putative acetyltransferase